ncbi:GGDEF domain-containing protein [Methylobacterium sp. Leaf466]|uniref:GGDEF domain-containing protein n=1 Tax=Methylobacterium sp. Leaf466 TaxID=1736386 RepID=UPI0006FCEBF9|nr:GGDEF domain-containing protein [Methylobacterium sp. Leaf466]KQT84235.1 diguanylate cyclase [Methylobacterium sp. Leaf466]
MQTVLTPERADAVPPARSLGPQFRLILQGGLVLAMLAAVLASFIFTNTQRRTLIDLREGGRQVRIAQEAVADAAAHVFHRAFGPDDGSGSLQARALETLRVRKQEYAAVLAPVLEAAGDADGATVLLDRLDSTWREAIDLIQAGRRGEAQALLAQRRATIASDGLRAATDAFLAQLNGQFTAYENRIEAGTLSVMGFQVLIGVLMLLAVLSAAREAQGRAAAIAEATSSRRQVKRLFDMTDMLQSAANHLDANAVLRATAGELIPGLGGALYVFNNSRDRLTLSTSWDIPAERSLPAMIGLDQCWALKRGKPHRNGAAGLGLCCEHHVPGSTLVEIPMIARGEILGLLQIFADGPGAEAHATAASPLGLAMADAMSLALSNLSLREKLRNQALRDPLTGLYNRRYMEDSLDRFVRLAERENRRLAVIMIDLDHFKRLNDEHGHATGDAVLREAAGAIVGALRETDVACRYGGEEMIVLMPDCDLENAADKAEVIRQRIEALSGQRGATVSASFGVSSIPATASGTTDLVRSADAALYKAKQAGRNRVDIAPLRSGRKDGPAAPRLQAVMLDAAE